MAKIKSDKGEFYKETKFNRNDTDFTFNYYLL